MPKLTLFDPQKDYSDKVLIVDDDEDDFEITLYNFRESKFENEILWLSSGQRMIDYLLRQNDFEKTGHENPVLIFLDVNMPEMNAEETLELLEKSMDISQLRIVLLTNADREWLQNTKLEQLPYIQKPLSFDKMYEYVMQHKYFLFQ